MVLSHHIALICAVALAVAGRATAGNLSGPILDEGAEAEIVDVLQFPATDASRPFARIAIVRELPDRSGRLAANDLRGPLYLIDDGALTTYLDLRDTGPLRHDDLQWGLVGFAFHPDFGTNGLFYTAHTESLSSAVANITPPIPVPPAAHAVLTEWQATDPSADVFSGTSRELMRVVSPHGYHNLGEIGFDPGLVPGDPEYGLLYIAAGDFGSVIRGDPDQLQRLDTIYGCLLRIDPLGGPFERHGIVYEYGIPPSNPWADDGDPDTFGEIFALGFRNPQNFHFDRSGGGELYLTEIGEGNLEEVDVIRPGANYGWPMREGNRAVDPLAPYTVFDLPDGDDSLGFTYPVAQYDHEEGYAITGGFVVRNTFDAPLAGRFVFGDIVTGRFLYASAAELLAADDGDPSTLAQVYDLQLLRGGSPTTLLDLVRSETGDPNLFRTDVRFSSDRTGRLFVTTKQDGFLRELIPAGGTLTATVPALPRGQVRVVPNPSNPRTSFHFQLENSGAVQIRIFDVAGRLLRRISTGTMPPGPHALAWDGRDGRGRDLASGTYLYRLDARTWHSAGKLTLVR